jgi:hypothetical protein
VVGTGSAALCPCVCFLSPPTPSRGAVLGSAVRKVGRRARASGSYVALRSLRAAPCRGLDSPAHPAPSPCSPPAAPRLPCAARGARAPVRPQGLPGGPNPSPARRGESVAARRAPSVKAALATLGARGLDSARPAAALRPPPDRKNGLGLRAGRTGGAPAGRGASPARYPTRLAAGASGRGLARAAAPARARSRRACGRGLYKGRFRILVPGASQVVDAAPECPRQALRRAEITVRLQATFKLGYTRWSNTYLLCEVRLAPPELLPSYGNFFPNHSHLQANLAGKS